MKNKGLKLLAFVPALLLTACGYGLKEIYDGSVYNSIDYYENFYREWNKDINYHKTDSKIDNPNEETYQLDTDVDRVFTSFNDTNFSLVQPDASNYSYYYDLTEPENGQKSYGQAFALSNNESSFRYGYLSKLFNSQMFCHSKFEIARVQIDESGFGTTFGKEIGDYSYFALNFKASIDYRRDGVSTGIPAHSSAINLIINFFCKTDNSSYHRVPVSYQIDNIPTNAGENYIFFGFDLTNIKIDRCAGVSIEYQLISEAYADNHPDEGWTHCLLLYEMFLPYSTWH